MADAVRISKLGIHTLELSRTMLFDVPVEAKATYQREHVPLVSLMTRLNEKAIVGHPVTVESLEFGWCDDYIAHDSLVTRQLLIL